MAGAFTAEQRARMEDVGREFHIDDLPPGPRSLVEVRAQVFRHERPVRQPGEPTSSTFAFENPGAEQALSWIMTAEGGDVTDPSMAIDDRDAFVLPVELPEGWSLRYEGDGAVTLRNPRNQPQRSVDVPEDLFLASPGRHRVTLDGRLSSDEVKLRLELRPKGEAEAVGR